MPFNPNGSWTSPSTGRTLNRGDPGLNMTPAERRERDDDLTRGVGKDPDAIRAGTESVGLGLPPGYDLLVDLGLLPKQVTPGAPGGSLDTTDADAERERISALLGQLQQQASTGGGAWEGSLADATAKADASVSAIGQSQPGVGYANALRNIGNAQGAVAQRAVGQSNILREKSKMDATSQIADLLGGQGDQDVNQAEAAAAAAQGRKALNQALNETAGANRTNLVAGAGGLFSSMSDGGEVPGRAPVFGDDSKNDIVPAKLSPGEIVIPRSHSGSPEAAADFVRALQANGQPQGFDSGGTVPGSGLENTTIDDYGKDNLLKTFFLPHAGLRGGMESLGGGEQAPSIQNGGLLNTAAYDSGRAASLANADALAQRAAGAGPSLAPQQMQNSTDSNIAAAMQASAGGRGAAGAGDVVAATGQAGSAAAGRTAATTAGEQQAGQLELVRALLAQRAQDQALARSKQQAAFRNTQMNAGISLAQQAQLRNILGGAGQALSGHSAGAGGNNNSADPSSWKQASFDSGTTSASDPGEWNTPDFGGGRGSPSDISDPNDKWAGGEIEDTRAADFLAALRRKKAA